MKYNSEQSGVAGITVYNLVGEEVLEALYPLFTGENLFKLNTSQLENGSYILVVSDDIETERANLLILK